MKKTIIYLSLVLLPLVSGCAGESVKPSEKLQAFPLSSVRLADGPFKHASEVNDKYVLSHDPDKLLAPFLKDAGLQPKAENYGNWESMGLDGHTGGHYLSSLALIAASEGNREAYERLDYMLDELARCQEANGNGYVGGIPGGKVMWEEIREGNIRANNFGLNDRWVPLYNIDKLFAGLIDVWNHTGNDKAKKILIGLSDYFNGVFGSLSDEQLQDMLRSEHGGLNKAFADVFQITGDERYMVMAQRLSHKFILDPLLQGEDRLSGLHANTQIPKVIGFMTIGEMSGKEDWKKAADFFWHTVVNHRSISIGGNSTYEHFHPADDFSSMVDSRQGPETCNTYNMLKLSRALYLSSGNLEYMDYYERAMYNHILGSQHPEHGGLVYFTPMRPQHYRVYSNPGETFWCCVGSGIENHAKYGELIYAHDRENLYVNLFISSELIWAEKGVKVSQETLFPESENSTITINMEQPSEFTVFVRHPRWNDKAPLTVKVNGRKVRGTSTPGGYFAVTREWEDGDKIEVGLDMYAYGEYLPDHSPYMSILYGPVVLASSDGDNRLDGLVADGSRMGHVANGPLVSREDVPVMVTGDGDWSAKLVPVEGSPLTFKADGLFYPVPEGGIELMPFYRVHDARYTVYWNVTTKEEFDAMKAEIEQKEKELMALEAATIDFVQPGQQQPETEHSFKSKDTENGVHQDRHWRHARGWFSYELKDSDKEAAKLRITCFGQDSGRNFDILMNGMHLATVNLDGTMGDTFVDMDFEIPAEVLASNKDGKYEVKFVAHPGSIAGGIFGVRLIRNN